MVSIRSNSQCVLSPHWRTILLAFGGAFATMRATGGAASMFQVEKDSSISLDTNRSFVYVKVIVPTKICKRERHTFTVSFSFRSIFSPLFTSLSFSLPGIVRT